MALAVVVFAVTYIAIASRSLHHILKLERPGAAICGGVLMVVVGALSLDQALASIDLHVIVLLFGVLVMAAYLTDAGFFKLAAYLVLTRARTARRLLVGLVFVAGGLSALLLNDTVCVVLTPLVVIVVVEAKLPPLPYLIGLAAAANVGGVVSFSGNPQNMIVGAAAHGQIGFAHYLVITFPVGIACLAIDAWLLGLMFHLPDGPLVERELEKPVLDRALTIKGLVALGVFAVLALFGFALAGAAMVAAVALILASRRGVAKAFGSVDWPLLVFFAGLFVVVAGIQHAGLVDKAFHALEPVIARGDWLGDAAFIALIVIGSQLVSNVPIAVIAVAWVPHMPDPVWGYVMLAVASTLAGTLTPLGSVANIIVMEAAGEHGHINFGTFLKYGLVITLANCAAAFAILGLERVLGFV